MCEQSCKCNDGMDVYREFGLSLPSETDPVVGTRKILDSYRLTQNKCFPTWTGKPDYGISYEVDRGGKITSCFYWYARVPSRYVLK